MQKISGELAGPARAEGVGPVSDVRAELVPSGRPPSLRLVGPVDPSMDPADPDPSDPTPRRVLVIAFACDPNDGSERAAGWGMALACAGFADEVVVIVHDRHLEALDAWKETAVDDPARDRLHFVPVAESPRMLRLAERVPPNYVMWRMRYFAWLRRATVVAQSLEAVRPFDAAIHAALGMYWMPSPVGSLDTPGVWGPVGGAASSPVRLWGELGAAGVAAEWAEVLAAQGLTALPSVRRTRDRTAVTLVESHSSRRRMPRRMRARTGIVNRAILVEAPHLPEVRRQPYLVFTSPLQRRKGCRLAIRALATTPDHVRLLVLNTGPEEDHLRRLAVRLGVADRVEFRGKVPRDEMFATLAGAAGSVHTGLREEGGAALAEAMLGGVPVIVLAHGGARILAEASLDPSRTALITPAGRAETARRLGAAMTRFVEQPSEDRSPYLDQDGTKRAIRAALVDAMRIHASRELQAVPSN